MTNESPAAVAVVSASPNTMRPSPRTLERQSTVVQNAAAVTTDVTRRMICGGLAGMIAKVRQQRPELYSQRPLFVFVICLLFASKRMLIDLNLKPND
jgi:hypothetical protein